MQNFIKGEPGKPAASSTDVFETLVEALAHPDSAVRISAAREFVRRKDKRGMRVLLEALKDKDREVRLQAANALTELGWRPVSDLHKAYHLMALGSFEELIKLGDAAIEPLSLILKDQAANLRMAALETLTHINSPKVVKPFIEVLDDENPHVRAVAVQALSRTGDAEAVEAIIKLGNDTSWVVKSVVLDACETMGSPQCVELMIRMLRDESSDLRHRACDLLGRVKDERSISSLVMTLVDEDAAVRGAAGAALRQVDAAWEKTEAAKDAVPTLLQALKHKNDDVREAAAELLRNMGQTRAMNNYLSGEEVITSDACAQALILALSSQNRDLRQAATEALGQVGGNAAAPALVRMLKDADEKVREAAVYSLNLLKWQPTDDFELVAKAVILRRWDTAVLFESLALEPLVLALNSVNPEVCRSALEALGKIGDRRVAEPLAVLLEHPEKSVRAAAAQALKAMGWNSADGRKAALQAIELQEWEVAARQGESAVEPLIHAIKDNMQNPEQIEAAANAMAMIADVLAVRPLLNHVRDGQVSAAVIRSLQNLVSHKCASMDDDELRRLAALTNIFQFQYTFNPRFNSYVRAGMQEIDTAQLRKQAMQEMARRGIS